MRRQLAEGFAYLFRTGWLFATLAFAILYVLVVIGPIEVLLPFAVRDRVGAGPAGLSLVLAAYGVGSAAGALLGVVAAPAAPLPDGDAAVLGPGSLPLAAFGLATVLWLMVVASFAVGVTDAAAMVIWGTLLQRRVPPHLLGRVSSLDFFVSLALLPVSMALAGPVGERVGIPVTFVVAALVPPLLAVVALVAWRLPATRSPTRSTGTGRAHPAAPRRPPQRRDAVRGAGAGAAAAGRIRLGRAYAAGMVQRRLPRPSELAPLLRPAPFVRDATARRLRRAASVADLRAIARRRTPRRCSTTATEPPTASSRCAGPARRSRGSSSARRCCATCRSSTPAATSSADAPPSPSRSPPPASPG